MTLAQPEGGGPLEIGHTPGSDNRVVVLNDIVEAVRYCKIEPSVVAQFLVAMEPAELVAIGLTGRLGLSWVNW